MNDDLISRQAAIELAMQYCPDDDGTCSKADEDIRNLLDELEDLPSAHPEPQWIPCSERLPEAQKKTYWICTDSGYQCECRWTNVNHIWPGLTTDWHWHIVDVPQFSKVVAWMPLPEPYKEVEDAAD